MVHRQLVPRRLLDQPAARASPPRLEQVEAQRLSRFVGLAGFHVGVLAGPLVGKKRMRRDSLRHAW
ncbi:hypothetical protein [Mumia zhuanghuii]|uniref:Uncharacterized protein n=1 Tax=Mumia zhuanghuii TaxID=2585211 RepID=A0A5C4MKR1_9ACTN|nr:hypothetical protein [Mumia zhuanghuii]TNC41847.1 hypothetical protein FHE65_21705 [Mumia zhuanghuii]